jgi:hypothetical protein
VLPLFYILRVDKKQLYFIVKRLFIFLIITQLLSSNHFLPELMKLPQLLRHYAEHRVENNALDFVAFLTLHYANSEHQQKDAARHGDLPLQSTHCAHHADFLKMAFPNTLPIWGDKTSFLVDAKNQKQRLYTPFFYDSKIHFSIFQPPRVG